MLRAGKEGNEGSTERLEGVVTGVVTTKVVVTTQGGVVTTPNTPCFHVFWGYNLTTPLLRPFSGRRILFKCPLHTARCHARCDFEVCLPLPWHAARFRITARCVRRHRAASPATADPCHRRCNRPQAWRHRLCLQAERAPEQPAPRATKMSITTERREFAGKFAPAPACLRDVCRVSLPRPCLSRVRQ